MPSFELSKLQGVSPARALSESDRTQIEPSARSAKSGSAAPSPKPGVALEVGAAIDPSSPPVDQDRVSQIKRALQDGSYPLVPTKIADAIIAARVGLGVDAT